MMVPQMRASAARAPMMMPAMTPPERPVAFPREVESEAVLTGEVENVEEGIVEEGVVEGGAAEDEDGVDKGREDRDGDEAGVVEALMPNRLVENEVGMDAGIVLPICDDGMALYRLCRASAAVRF